MERIGVLSKLCRYPVKSMAAEELDSVRVTFAGLVGDRVWAFMDNDNKSNFPWLTARQGHELILFRPRFLDGPLPTDGPTDPTDYATEVTTPDGETFRVDDSRLTKCLEKRFGRSLRPCFSNRSIADSQPASFFGMATLRALSKDAGKNLDPRTFRSNFYVDFDNSQPGYENSLIGQKLQLGKTAVVEAVKKNTRCVIITLNPEDGSAIPKVLETVTRRYNGCVGIYGAVLQEGIVHVNDPIYLI